MNKLKNEWYEFNLLLKSVPPVVLVLFVMSVFCMNLLANKSINIPFEWLALDCGIIVSWFLFLVMDIITSHFGPKAANELSIVALLFNLIFCSLLFLGSKIPGAWGESYSAGNEELINGALNRTFGGTWYVLLGSSIAFISSAFVNNFINFAIGRAFKNSHSFAEYISRSYISTAIGQFTDNFVFALLVSHFFFGWTLIQCVTCAVTGMLAELFTEIVFSFFGFRIVSGWRHRKIGEEYLSYIKERKN